MSVSRPYKCTSQLHLLTYHATCTAKHVWITSGNSDKKKYTAKGDLSTLLMLGMRKYTPFVEESTNAVYFQVLLVTFSPTSSSKSNLGLHMCDLQSIVQVWESQSLTLQCLKAWNGDAMKKDLELGYQIPGSRTWYCLVSSSTWYFRWRWHLHFWDSNGVFYYLLHSLFVQFHH